jgi:glycosyltransferase involved in cell wall biosynthesis
VTSTDLHDIGKMFSCLLYPSRPRWIAFEPGEGFPNAIAESLLCETPFIATDVGHTRHILGEDGIVVASGEAGAIASAVRNLPQRDHLSAATAAREARERIAVSFSERALVCYCFQTNSSVASQRTEVTRSPSPSWTTTGNKLRNPPSSTRTT